MRRAAVPLLFLVLLVGCGAPPPSTPDGPPLVVATTAMIGDLASRIAGPSARVETLLASGVDPHLYKPSAGDVRRIAESRLVLYNGLHLEGKMAEVLAAMAKDRPVLPVAEAVPRTRLRKVAGFAGEYDPHLWFDVSAWAETVEPIRGALAGLIPEKATDFEANARALRAELEELDRWVADRIATIPPERRILVTAHDAFGYFGDRYGLEVVGLQGVSTVTEAGLRDVERLAARIARDRIPAIFVESSVPRRSIEAVQAACRAAGHEVRIGGQLYSDAMGPPGTPDGTYVGMVRHNVDTIVEALR